MLVKGATGLIRAREIWIKIQNIVEARIIHHWLGYNKKTPVNTILTQEELAGLIDVWWSIYYVPMN